MEICEQLEGDDGDDDSLRVAIAVFYSHIDCVPLDVLVNSRIGLRLSGQSCKGAVVHVTGDNFTPTEELFPDRDMNLPGFVDMDDVVLHENGVGPGDIDEDSEEEIDLGLGDIPLSSSDNMKVEFQAAVADKRVIPPSGRIPPLKAKPKKSLPEVDAAHRATILKKAKNTLSIVKHPSGLQFQDLLVGSGPFVLKGHNVALQYELRLENGKVVDKAERKRPFKFRLGIGECIKGFDIGVTGMREGGQRHLIVPPELGYSDQKVPGIPPNSTLFFDVSVMKAF